MNCILIVAHAPLASALRQCVLHVFPECGEDVLALDVQPNASPDETLHQLRALVASSKAPRTLLLTDMFGATPSNVAQKLVNGVSIKLIAGVNLPMLLRTVCYRHESLEALVNRALVGATQGVMQVALTAPQNQTKRNPDAQEHGHHQ